VFEIESHLLFGGDKNKKLIVKKVGQNLRKAKSDNSKHSLTHTFTFE